jgi:transposase
LLAVEQGFLAAKTLLATRPIFHRTDAAIRGHIFCTFLALVVSDTAMTGLVLS